MTAVAHVLGTPGTGGVPVVAHALLRRLTGYRRHLYYLTDRSADPARRDATVAALTADGITVRMVPAAVATDKTAVTDQVADWVARDGIRLVHTHSTRPNHYGRAAAMRVPGVAVVAHYHNHYDDRWSPGSPALEVEQRLAGGTDHAVACSASVREHVVERLGLPRDRVSVVPNGVDVARFAGGDGMTVRRRLGVPEGTTVIGAVGRICAQKAPDDVLEAVAPLLQRDRRPTELWFVGAPDDHTLTDQLHRRATTLGVGDHVRFLGYRQEVADVYAALDCVVLASRWEGYGLVVAEAMAAGRPVVATRVGGIAEAAGDAALLVPPQDPAGLSGALRRVVDDPALAADLATRGVRRASGLGWDGAVGMLEQVYAEVLQRRTAAAAGVACAREPVR